METAVDLFEMFSLQLSEIEMLQSMYPNADELQMDHPLAQLQVQKFVDGDLDYDLLECRLGFTLRLDIADKGNLEMVCQLPHEYPAVSPVVFLRSEVLPRSQHRQLSDALQTHISSLDRGEICMGSIIEWLQENATNYMQKEDQFMLTKSEKTPSPLDNTFCRMWIYSHHIYSKIKRKDILAFAAELQLTGFSMPGKPGMICLEGSGYNVEDFWQRIRRMQWKRLVMKEKQDTPLTEGQSIDSWRKFERFEEKHFEPRQGKGRGAHMDIGLLYQFLEQHGCANIFPLYFGVEGRPAEEDSD